MNSKNFAPPTTQQAKPDLILPSNFVATISIDALVRTAMYIVEHGKEFKHGDFFRLTGRDGKIIRFNLVD